MSEKRIEVVRAITERWADGDFAAGADLLDSEVQFIVRPDFPAPVSCAGPAEIGRYMRGFLEEWATFSIRADELRLYGDTVLAKIVQVGAGRSSGVSGEQRAFMLITFRGDRIIRIESVLREADALEAVGAAE